MFSTDFFLWTIWANYSALLDKINKKKIDKSLVQQLCFSFSSFVRLIERIHVTFVAFKFTLSPWQSCIPV